MVSVNNRATSALRRVLDTPGLRVDVADPPSVRIPVLDVRYRDAVSRLVPVWAGTGYPQDIRRALRELDELGLGENETPVLVVRRMSPGAAALLEERSVSWVDEHGRALVTAPPALLVSRGPAVHRPVAPESKRDDVVWADGSAAVAEFLLTLALPVARRDPGPLQLPPGSKIAERVGVSTALVSRTFAELDAMEWTEKSGAERGTTAARHLVDPTAMLSSWALWYSHRRVDTVLAHALYDDPLQFVRERIAGALPVKSWAVTGWLALEQRAPFMTSIPRTTLYVDPGFAALPGAMEEFLAATEMREVDRGARVALITSDHYALRSASASDVVPLVSDVRLYGDLLRDGGVRGSDAAEHLREEVIGF